MPQKWFAPLWKALYVTIAMKISKDGQLQYNDSNCDSMQIDWASLFNGFFRGVFKTFGPSLHTNFKRFWGKLSAEIVG